MAEDWIARGLAAVATIAAVANSYISYRKLEMDREARLPPMRWKVTRPKPREINIEATITNDRSGMIEAKDFFIGDVPGAYLVDLGGDPVNYPEFSGFYVEPRRMTFADQGSVPPGEARNFLWRVLIADQFPAPHPLQIECWLDVDLANGARRDQRFKFKRTV